MATANQAEPKLQKRILQILYSWSFRTLFSLLIGFHISAGLAQVPTSPITSSGLNTHISGPIPTSGKTQYDITGGSRAGSNLFHSFGDFNVPNKHIANFLNDTGMGTTNILGRVTSGNASNIFGTIQTSGFESANLFLMNPAGIVFGPNASLHVGGSIAFTTADYLRLADNGRFYAIPNARVDTLLSTAPVAAYGFLGSNPGPITIQGSQFAIPKGQGISFIGGNITIQNGTLENGTAQPAYLSAPKGQINLATTKSAGEFLQDLTAAPNINGASFSSFGSTHFASGSTVDFSQSGNGMVSIRGGQLVLEIQTATLDTAGTPNATATIPRQDTIVLTPGSSLITETSSADQAPAIHLQAERISIQGTDIPDTSSQSPAKFLFTGITSNTHGGGNAGNITLDAIGDIKITNLVNLESASRPNTDAVNPSPVRVMGNAGDIALTSTHGNILITRNSTITSQTFSSAGNTGTLMASAPQGNIVLTDSVFFTFLQGMGKAGEIHIDARNLDLKNSAINDANLGPLKPDGIAITLSGNLTLTDASVIATASMSPTDAPAADINLTAKDITVTGGSIINSGSFLSGDGGNLKIAADSLRIADGGQLSTGSTRAPNRGQLLELLGTISPTGQGGDISIHALGPSGTVTIDGAKSGIFAETEGTGAGGTINLFAKSLTIQNGGTISTSTTGTNPRATGGSITVNATDQVMLTSGGSITASSIVKPETSQSGIASAGNISINAGQHLDLLDHSSITTTTQTAQANGGDIDIRAIDRVRVVNSTISTSVHGAEGSGGNIFIDPNVVILEGSDVTAQAVGGAGGNITLVTPLFLADSASLISASSQRGVSGTVTIQSPTSNLSGSVGQLVSKMSPPQVLLQNRCVALAGGEQSTFLLAGRDTLPTEPDGWLNSPVSMEHLTGESTEQASSLKVRSKSLNRLSAMSEKKDNTNILSLRQLTPPGFLVRTFATGSTGCPS